MDNNKKLAIKRLNGLAADLSLLSYSSLFLRSFPAALDQILRRTNRCCYSDEQVTFKRYGRLIG